MIIQFSFTNYKTFKDKTVLNMVASNYDKDTRENENIAQLDRFALRILKSCVLYGANASGKSKFIEGITFFNDFIQNSSKDANKNNKIDTQPFLLSEETRSKNTEFEIMFILDDHIYRYGFEISRDAVSAEWLYSRKKGKETELFYRQEQDIEFNEPKLKKVGILIKEDLIRSNALLLSVLAQFNDTTAKDILSFLGSINCISGLSEKDYKNNSLDKVKDNPEKTKQILGLLKSADFGIEEIRYEDISPLLGESDRKKIQELTSRLTTSDPHILAQITTVHKIFDASNKVSDYQSFRMSQEESQGTQKYFYFTGLVLDALEHGTIMIVDELDSKLHPNLVCKLVSLFNSNVTNPKNAQLIFNTHDTNLLSSGLFRRDQIWFIAKNKYGASTLYSLADFKTTKVRKNELFEENYIRGKYGATPFLGDFDEMTQQILAQNGQKG